MLPALAADMKGVDSWLHLPAPTSLTVLHLMILQQLTMEHNSAGSPISRSSTVPTARHSSSCCPSERLAEASTCRALTQSSSMTRTPTLKMRSRSARCCTSHSSQHSQLQALNITQMVIVIAGINRLRQSVPCGCYAWSQREGIADFFSGAWARKVHHSSSSCTVQRAWQ